MLLRNAHHIGKNHIIFLHNGLQYYQDINNDTKLNLFNRDFMNVFLEQYEPTLGIVRYDDIEQMSTLENHDRVIENLPNSLKVLTIMSTMCETLRLNGDVCENIEMICIDKSNMNLFPDVSHCPRLRVLKINHSAIRLFNIDYELPRSLQDLNLQTNLLINNQFAYEKLWNCFQNKRQRINLSDNHLKYDLFPQELAFKCSLVRQETYVWHRINFENVANENIMQFVHAAAGLGGARAAAGGANNNPPEIDPLLGGQNVHLSSVNKSVVAGVNILKEYIEKNKLEVTPLNSMKGINPSKVPYVIENKRWFNEYKQKNTVIQQILTTDFGTVTSNSITKLTYSDTFELIWTVICDKHRKKQCNLEDVWERITIEILDGQHMCFTGKYNRLLNAMVGVVEGIQVGFSEGEELQLEFGRLIERLNNKTKEEYTDAYVQAYCDAVEILSSVKEEHTRKTWLTAILDLEPDPKQFTYDRNGKQYYKSWDNNIISLREKDVIGYWMPEEEMIFFLSVLDDEDN